MEAVHKTDTRSWILAKLNVKQFRNEWYKKINSVPPMSTKKELKLSTSENANVEKEVGLNAMKCPAQDYLEISKEFSIPDNVALETLRLQKIDVEKRQKDPKYESFVYCSAKNYNYPTYHHAGITTVNPEDIGHEKVEEPEVLLWVQIFRPEKRSTSYHKYTQPRMPNFAIDQEFIVLGSQYLTELRDRIDCISDKAIPGDYSEYPELPPETTCKDLYKSGFFYIDGTFYNDMRHPDCRDYSEPIISWAMSSNRGVGPFHKTLMERSKFIDLDIQLGYPYVYVHQGDCEHLIVFSDLQLYTHHYCNNRLQYPLHVSLKPKRRVLCMICRIQTAEWIVFGNQRLPENPFYFCKTCFFSFNYDENNQKIGNFRAYHHVDRSTIL